MSQYISISFKYWLYLFIFGLNSQTILTVLQYTASFSSILPLILFLLFQRNNKNKELRVIFFYFTYCVLNELFAYLFFVVLRIEASYLYYLFSIVEFSFFSYYFSLIIHNSTLKKLLLPITILFIIFVFIDYLLLRNKTSFNSISSGIETVLIISMCIYYFFDQLKQPNTFLIYSSINFWIIIGFLIYLAGTFFLYIYADKMLADKAFRRIYLIINSSAYILKNVLFSVAMLMKPDKNTHSIFPEDSLNADWNSKQSLHNLN